MAASIPALCFSFFLLLTATHAIDIVKELQGYPDLSTFSKYLAQTKVADEINSRKTITVLAVDNANIMPLNGKSVDDIKKSMMIHVLLDYYDQAKLKQMPKSTPVTTLFQTSGLASGQQGFLNVTNDGGFISFGDSAFVKSVDSQPYTISILQVNSVIIPSASGSRGSGSASPAPSKSTAPATPPTNSSSSAPTNSSSSAPTTGSGSSPKPSPPAGGAGSPKSSPSPTPATGSSSGSSSAPTPSAPTPSSSGSGSGSAASPAANAPKSDSGATAPVADGPTADGSSPIASPPGAADGPVAEGPVADGPAEADAPAADAKSGAAQSSGFGFAALFMIIVSSSAWIQSLM